MDKKFNSDFYKHILDKINSNIFITDTETDEIVYMNDCMKKSFNLQDTEGKTCWEVLSGDATERCNFCKVNKLEKSGQVCFSREKNAVTGRVYMNCDMLESYDGKLYHVRNSADITDSVRLSTEASVDELTGVINRSAGKKRLSEMLSNPDSRKFTVALYDINGLKWVNDTYGHLEGDKLLVFTAQNIQQALDEEDFIFRLSGDEFIVVFCGKDIKQAELRMENMLSILEERKPLSNINYDVSFSYGLAAINGGEHLTVSDVLSIADTQMYIQKRDRHIMLGQKRLQQSPARIDTPLPFSYNKDYVFEAVSDCTDDYMFIGNIQKKSMICSQKMSVEFNLPISIEENVIDLISQLIHEDDLQIFLKSVKEITDGGAKLHTATYRAKNAYGKWVNLLCKGKIINDNNGNPELFAGVIRNLDKEYDLYASNMDLEQFISSASCINHGNIENSYSDNTQQAFCFMENTVGNERLKTEVKLLNFVNRNLPGGISAVYDKPDYPIFCINQAILSYTNYTYSEFMEISDGKLIRLIHKDDREFFSAQMQKQLEKDGIYETKCRFIRKDGKPIWVYSRGKYVTDDNGKRLIVSFFIDVTKE
ncbi:MAG: diguanylate cyclase domain-containing protein, partial [Hominimerdicola sp.]